MPLTCQCTYGFVSYIIVGIICCLNTIFGIITLSQVGRVFPFERTLYLIVGLLEFIPYGALTAIWAVGFKKQNPALKMCFAITFLIF